MSSITGALRRLMPVVAVALAAACARENAPGQAQIEWTREALARNPGLDVVAVDPKGVFTVRMHHGGELYTVSVNDVIAAPPGVAKTSAPAAAPLPVPGATDAEEPDTMAQEGPAGEAETAPEATGGAGHNGITVTRDAGRISITGPGVSIASATAPAPGGEAGTAAAAAVHAPGSAERRSQPMICEGERLMHIDNRAITFDGDGLIVRDGCDLYLTNSRIAASGTAITVAGGKVHIVNSDVGGAVASIDASQGAQVYLSRASIDGLQRRFDSAQISDLGGNRYR
ncbi:MAG: hypothetical protein AB7G76_16070 [Steroidobacteraceae bacterium]